jgi:hypothetical protein
MAVENGNLEEQGIQVSTLTQSIVVLLTEAYQGPPDPSGTWFIDNEPDCGILGILKGVSPIEASISVDGSGKAGSTIASNVEHLRWSLANANAALQGADYNSKWSESWNLLNADQASWDGLRDALRDEYESLCETITKQEDLPGEYLNGVLALIPHAAFHLGIIRQMIERVRSVVNH